MLGQPASSQTVCRPSRRTSDFSSVYSGPVLRRVLIHSGFRSIGTWLLRTSRRSSFRLAGSSGEPEECAGVAVSLMISTVLADDDAPAGAQRGRRPYGWRRSDLLVVRSRGRAGVRAAAAAERLRCVAAVDGRVLGTVAVGELGVADPHVGLGRGWVAGGLHGGGDSLAGIARGTGHAVLSVGRCGECQALSPSTSGPRTSLRTASSSSPSAICDGCMPRSESSGVESPAANSASETVVPKVVGALGALGAGSSR